MPDPGLVLIPTVFYDPALVNESLARLRRPVEEGGMDPAIFEGLYDADALDGMIHGATLSAGAKARARTDTQGHLIGPYFAGRRDAYLRAAAVQADRPATGPFYGDLDFRKWPENVWADDRLIRAAQSLSAFIGPSTAL